MEIMYQEDKSKHFPPQQKPSSSRTEVKNLHNLLRSEERRVGKGVDLGGRRIIKKKKHIYTL